MSQNGDQNPGGNGSRNLGLRTTHYEIPEVRYSTYQVIGMDPEQVLSLRLLGTELYNDLEKPLVRSTENAGKILNTVCVRSFPCEAMTAVRQFLCAKDEELSSWVPRVAKRGYWEGRD